MGQRQNTILLNVSAGETTPELYGRIDLPAYQRSYQRVQNFEVLPQGSLRYRNGDQHVHNTAGLGTGRLLPFTFNQEDTYIMEFTQSKLRFYRDYGLVCNAATFNITGITNADPGVITVSAVHGYSNGQEVILSGIVGMLELNDQAFLVANVTTYTFTITDLFGNAIDTTSFLAWISGGLVETPYQISHPYEAADLNQIHISQSADVINLTHQDYMPYRLTRSGLANFSVAFFTRTEDPFMQQQLAAATAATLGVFTTPTPHGFAVGDTIYIDGFVGGTWTTLNQKPRTFTVNTVPTTTTFTLNQNGTPLNTSGFGTYTTLGTVIDTLNCPLTSAYMSSSRLAYANTRANPPGIIASMLPDPTTGKTNFDNYTPGANDNQAYYFTMASVFNLQDAIQWIATNNSVVVIGCAGSVRQLTGSGGAGTPITPSSIDATAISNTGAAAIQPYSNGLTVFYVDQTTFRICSFAFNIQVYNYVVVNQNLIANQLSTSPFITVSQQRREASLLWILREDGVLAGMTFNEIESVYGWHRHYRGGNSEQQGAIVSRATVLSAAIEQRQNSDSVLWVIVEREFANGNTYRSVEYWNTFQKFYDPYDYFGGESNYQGRDIDIQAYKNATSEQLKNSIHLDCNITYDGSVRGTAAGATLSFAVLGTYNGQIDGLASGWVYGSEFVTGAVYGYNLAGTTKVLTFAQTESATLTGLAIDSLNNLAYQTYTNGTYVAVVTQALGAGTSLTGPLAPGAILETTIVNSDSASVVQVSPDGKNLYVAGSGAAVKIDTATGIEIGGLNFSPPIVSGVNGISALSPDGTLLYVASGINILQISTATMTVKQLFAFTSITALTGFCMSSDGKYLAVADADTGNVCSVNVATGVYQEFQVANTQIDAFPQISGPIAFVKGSDTTLLIAAIVDNTGANKLYEYTTAGAQVSANTIIDSTTGIYGMAVDPKSGNLFATTVDATEGGDVFQLVVVNPADMSVPVDVVTSEQANSVPAFDNTGTL